jgi:hypothetical protein
MSVTVVTRPLQRTTATDAPPADPLRAWLACLPADLPAFAPIALSPTDHCRTSAEAHAAARAAACPDLFLVHAAEPNVGEHVIADVARLAAAQRVLILSPDPGAADRIAERLAKLTPGGVVRALAEDENPIRPSPVVAKVTSVALGTGKVEQLKRETSAAVAAAEARLTAVTRMAALDAEIADLTAARDRIEAAVRAETGTPCAARLAQLQAEYDHRSTCLQAEWQPVSAARKEKESALAAIRKQRAEAERKPGFFARLLGMVKHGPDAAEIEKRVRVLETETAALATKWDEFQARADAETAAFAAEREKLIRETVATRRAESDSQLAELSVARNRLQAEVGPNPPPTREAAEQQLAAARDRLADLTRNAPDFVRRSLAEPRVVVGTPASLHADPVFHRDASAEPPFGLLVLDRCEDLTEPDFLRLAKLASRWVLVGDAAAPHGEPKPQLNGAPGRNGRGGRPVEVSFAARLARLLDRERWVREADRLVCRLTHPTPDQRRGMTREPLLDRPEIELRFTADAAGEPVLAEVAFPAATTVAAAKSFLFHQVGEVLLHPCGVVRWDHTPAALTACWPAAEHGTPATDATWIDLEPGVREKVVGAGLAAFTAAVAFDPSAGWDAAKAEAWLARHLPAESAARFAAVPSDASSKRR